MCKGVFVITNVCLILSLCSCSAVAVVVVVGGPFSGNGSMQFVLQQKKSKKWNKTKSKEVKKTKKTFPNGSLFNRWHKFIRSTDKLTSFISCLSISKPHSFVSTLWIIGCEFSEIFCLFFHVEGTINHKRHPLNLSLLLASLLEFKRKTKLIIIYIKMSTISPIHTNIHTQTFNMCGLVFCFGFCLHFFNLLSFFPFSFISDPRPWFHNDTKVLQQTV